MMCDEKKKKHDDSDNDGGIPAPEQRLQNSHKKGDSKDFMTEQGGRELMDSLEKLETEIRGLGLGL